MEQHTITQSKGNYVLSDFIWGSIIRQTKSCIQSFFPKLIIVCCVFAIEMSIVWNSCPPVCSQWDGMKYLGISAGLDLNHAWWHVSIHDNISHAAHNLCGSVPISGLNIIKSFLTEIINMLVLGDQDEVRWHNPGTLLLFLGWQWAWAVIPVIPALMNHYHITSGGHWSPRIISCHQSDYPHMPHHVLTRDLSRRHPIKPFHTRTTLWCIGGLLNNNWQRCKTKPGSNVPKRVFIPWARPIRGWRNH